MVKEFDLASARVSFFSGKDQGNFGEVVKVGIKESKTSAVKVDNLSGLRETKTSRWDIHETSIEVRRHPSAQFVSYA